MPAHPTLKLFGALLLSAGSVEVRLPRKARALLAALALSDGERLAREVASDMLWGLSGPDQARQSLRQSLLVIRRQLGFEVIQAERDMLSLQPDQIAVDTREFAALAASEDRRELERAAALYRGELLAGLPRVSPRFDEWLSFERRRLAGQVGAVLRRLAALHAASGERDAAIATAERLVGLDDLNEDAHRLLIRLLTEAGRRAEALRQYAICEDTLKRELGVVPDASTRALIETVRGGAVTASHKTPSPESGGRQNIPLPDKPSLAVLPFANLSGDPDQDYFADGMTTEITTAISRLAWLFVIARNSSFVYRGRAIEVGEIAQELGVRYVLRGSVRKAGNRVRIAGELVDTATGAQIWADRFDGALDDVFDLQDRVASSVAGAIEPRLLRAEIERSRRKPPERLDAYDLYLRGLAQTYRHSAEGFVDAVALLARALDIDPAYAPAAALLAWCRLHQLVHDWSAVTRDEIAAGVDLARAALETERDDAETMSRAAIALFLLAGETALASTVVDRALMLNPNSAMGWASRGWIDALRGRPDAGIEALDRALRLSPSDPTRYLNLTGIAIAHLAARRFEAAIEWAESALHDQPRFMTPIRIRIVAKAHLGRLAEARSELAQLLAMFPGFTVAQWRAMGASVVSETQEIFISGLRLAGLPES